MRKAFTTLSLLLFCGGVAHAQNSSIYLRDKVSGGIPMASSSLTFNEALRPREVKLNDLVTIRVTEISTYTNSGDATRRNNSTIDARLQNWLQLDGLNLGVASKEGTELPRARGSYAANTQAEGEIQNKELLQLNITARVVDIRPNGNYVLEARKTVTVDDEIIETALTGVVRREDIPSTNIVLSDKIAELDLQRRTVGYVRDSYKRGWLTRFWDRANPF
jgi:flagellar L-ring protein FlgH